MAGVIAASEQSWTALFSGLSPRQSGKLVTVPMRQGADAVRKGRPWSLPLKIAVLIVDDTLLPTRDHTIAERSKNYRYSTNHQVVIDADTRLAVVVGRPLAGNRNDCKAWEDSGTKAAVGNTVTILRNRRSKGDGAHHAMLGIARMHNLAPAG